MAILPYPPGRPPLYPPVARALERFSSIALHEMESVALLDRMDIKFILTEEKAADILSRVSDSYRVLEIQGFRASHDRTLYFDTPALDMYYAHHNGRRDRYKIRMRSYVDSNLTFFEVKRKNNRDRTLKTRIRVPELAPALDASTSAFVRSMTPYTPEVLVPTAHNDFLRVTLISLDDSERMTIDFSLRLGLHDVIHPIPRMVIVEVKQPRFSTRSPFVRALRAYRVADEAFSKYCLSIALLQPGVKTNMFKPRMRLLARLLEVPSL